MTHSPPRGVARNEIAPGDAAATGSNSAALRRGFDFTHHMRRLCRSLTADLPELAHIDLDRVAISLARARKRVSHGLYASLTPLRFAGGEPTIRRRGRWYAMQRVRNAEGRDMLYILTFYLPRFMDSPWREKLATVLHELWHISPEFNGDLRRHAGRCYMHSRSQAAYDAALEVLLDRWLAQAPPAELHAFLELDFDALRRRYGGVFGQKFAQPKLLPAPAPGRA